jgi:hypothetical protein
MNYKILENILRPIYGDISACFEKRRMGYKRVIIEKKSLKSRFTRIPPFFDVFRFFHIPLTKHGFGM